MDTEKPTSVLVTFKVWGTHGLIEMISEELFTCALLGDIEDKRGFFKVKVHLQELGSIKSLG